MVANMEDLAAMLERLKQCNIDTEEQTYRTISWLFGLIGGFLMG
jgi:hypothetical protein